jgi:hypothetical protein
VSDLRRTRPFVVWLACAAMLAGTLTPSIARALAAAQGLPFVVAELCSAGGGDRRIVIWSGDRRTSGSGPSRGTPTPRDDAGATHCPACLGAPDPAGPPPANGTAFVLATSAAAPPAASTGLAPVRRAWLAARPRAPPPPA